VTVVRQAAAVLARTGDRALTALVPATALRRSDELSQYEWVLDGQVVSVLGYELRGQEILLLHTATEPGQRERGHATALVGAVLQDVADRGLTTSVRCPFIRGYLQRQPSPG
jgi:predicted GNAT family acetyltransferase